MKTCKIPFSRTDLIHLRRFLNRAVRCCEENHDNYSLNVNAWYYVKPLIKKINDALEQSSTQT